MLKNASYYGLGVLIILCIFLYLRLDSVSAKLEKSQSDLNLAISANEQLSRNTRQLEIRHEQELKALTQSFKEKKDYKERVENVKSYIENSNENNLTKLFNNMVDRLWDENASSE